MASDSRFADLLARELSKRDLTQRQAAPILGVSQQNIGKWLRGPQRPSPENWPALAAFLGISEADLKAMLPPRNTMERVTLQRRVDELEARMDRLGMTVTNLRESLSR